MKIRILEEEHANFAAQFFSQCSVAEFPSIQQVGLLESELSGNSRGKAKEGHHAQHLILAFHVALTPFFFEIL